MVPLKTKLLKFSILCAAMLAGARCMYAQAPEVSGIVSSAAAGRSTPVAWEGEAVSSISIPVTLDLAELQKLANESVPERVSGASGDITWVVRHSGIKLSGRDGQLVATVAFTGSATYRKYAKGKWLGKWRVKLFQQSAKFTGTAEAVVGVQLTKDWNILPAVTVNIDLSKAHVRLFKAIKVSIRGLVEKKINAVALKAADKAVAKAFARAGLKERVAKVWERLHRTVVVKKAPDGFVQVDPVGAGISQLQITDKTVSTTVSIRTRLRGTLGKPLPPLVAEPLPPLNTAPVKNPGFHLKLPAILDPARLGTLMQERAERKAMKSGKGELKMKNIQASCAGGKLRISADINALPGEDGAEFTGTLAVEGIPALDTNNQTLAMKDLVYTLETQNKFAGAANWLLKDEVLRNLEKHLTVNLTRETDKMAVRLAKAAAKAGQKEGLVITLTGTVIRFASVEVRGDSLFVILTASGKAGLPSLPLSTMVNSRRDSKTEGSAAVTKTGKAKQPPPAKPATVNP